jgi:hypothetical protein
VIDSSDPFAATGSSDGTQYPCSYGARNSASILIRQRHDTRLLPHGGFPCPVPHPKDVAARPTPRCRQRESGSVSWSSRLRGPASTPGCRNPSDPGRYHDHSEPHIRFSSAGQDGPRSPARREDAKDSELPEPRSYELCVDELYNFVRPHRALKFGREVRTPAMQAGLTRRRLTLREIFSSRMVFRASNNALFALFDSVPSVSVAAWRMPMAA